MLFEIFPQLTNEELGTQREGDNMSKVTELISDGLMHFQKLYFGAGNLGNYPHCNCQLPKTGCLPLLLSVAAEAWV